MKNLFRIAIIIIFIMITFLSYKLEANNNDFLTDFISLSEESDDDDFYQNLNTFLKNNTQYISDKEPQITIITPGANSDITEFGMEKESNKYYFKDNSIVSYLKRRGSSIYATSLALTDEFNNLIEIPKLKHLMYVNSENSDHSGVTTSFLNGSNENYVYGYNFDNESFNSPIIIVFSPNYEEEGHKIYNYDGSIYTKTNLENRKAYDELELMTNYIIYTYMYKYYQAFSNNPFFQLEIPRINMIGHSRGGIINMQYAIEHPDIVDSLYSIGTPYNGSSIYDALMLNNDNVFELIFAEEDEITHEIDTSKASTDALLDCVDESSYIALKHYWNLYQESSGNMHTKLYAIAGTMGMDYFRDFLYHANGNDTKLFKILKWLYLNLMFSPSHDNIPYDVLSAQIPSVVNEAELHLYHVNNWYHSFESNSDIEISDGQYNINLMVGQTFDGVTITENMAGVIAGILNQMIYNPEIEEYVIENDLFFDKSSQQADGYNNVIAFEKVFTGDYYDLNMRSENSKLAIGHNLEACDEDIINCILSNIILGTDDNGFNIKKSENNKYEFIGFSYNKAVKNKLLIINPIMGVAEYSLSSKMFDCYYTQAQKRFKNRYDNLYCEIDSSLNDGINEIKLNTNIKAALNTFRYLKGNVKFNFNSYTMYNTTNKSFFLSMWNSLYANSHKLIKYGGNVETTNITINDINEVYQGAFLGQPLQELTIANLNSNYQSIEIGDYAFYGCDRLNDVNTTLTIYNLNQNAFFGSACYKNNDTYILSNLLIKAGSDLNIIDVNSPITRIATGAFGPNYESNYLVIKKILNFNTHAIQSTSIDNIFLYSSLIAIGMSSFDPVYYSDTYPNIYTAYSNYNNMYDSSVIHGSVNNTITIQFDLIGYTQTWNVAQYYQTNIIEIADLNLSDYNGYTITGFYNSTSNHHCYTSKIRDTFNLYSDAGKTFELYYCCNNHSLSEDYINSNNVHDLLCANCKYKRIENHNYTYQMLNNSSVHNSVCDCGYEKHMDHQFTYNGNNTNYTHELMCVDCGYLYTEGHAYDRQIIDYLGSFYDADICLLCGHLVLIAAVSVVDNGLTHTFSNGLTTEHDYQTVNYNNYDILICRYCNHHIHNGIIVSSGNYSGHQINCAYCNEYYYNPHIYENYTNQLSDLEDGYHSSICTECNFLLEEEHRYQIDNHYIDLHHYKCSLCNSTAVFHHIQVSSANSTSSYHTSYCDYCGYYYAVPHQNAIYIDGDGHHIECVICHYVSASASHTLINNCQSNNPHEHYKYCQYCPYTEPIALFFNTYHEYEHYCKCSVCNLQIIESHEEHCVYYDDEWHTYMCYCCSVNYLMPHFVNNHVIIYENYEPGYDLWVCTYCGYMEVRRREE